MDITIMLEMVVERMWIYLVIPAILGLGLYFTVATKFVQIRLFPKMIGLLSEGFAHKDKSGKKREGVSSFQAFAISIASRVGTGNLAGVATAIIMGGPGAIFWMWVMAFLGMASAFIESTLAQVYKIPVENTNYFRGGPAYYLRDALHSKKLSMLFSVLMIGTFGYALNMIQSNTISNSVTNLVGSLNKYHVAILLSLLTLAILLGGVKRIANISGFFVPVMAISYVLVGIVIVVMNYKTFPDVMKLIITDAFHGSAVAGGLIGTIMHGLRRGLFSNEAGMGSAPAAAASANTSHPAKQGIIQSFSVFTDTIIVCSVTAFIILSSGAFQSFGDRGGIVLMQEALTTTFHQWGALYLTIIIFFFAFTSVIGNYFYAESSLAFITNENRVAQTIFRLTVAFAVYFGAVAETPFVWTLGDLFSGLMAIVNFYAITRLFPVAKAVLDDFMQQLKEGKDPHFKRTTVKGLEVAYWED